MRTATPGNAAVHSLESPVEQVLATHGGPTDRAALERALA